MILPSRPVFLCLIPLLVLVSCSTESKIKQAIERGDSLLKEGKRDEAILNYKKALQLNANSGEGHYGMGRALFTPERMPEAYLSLTRAVELLPTRADVQTDLGDATLTLYLATPSRPEKLRERLIKVSEDLLKATPNSPAAFRFRAYVQMVDKKTVNAVQTLKQGLEGQPGDQRSQLALVKALLLDGKVDESDRAALQFISKNKQSFAFYDVMIDQYVRFSADSAKAERFLRLKAENNPHSAESMLSLARFYRNQKNPEGIVSALAPLLKDSAHFPSGQLQVADFYMEAQSYGPAEDVLRQAIASNPSVRDAACLRLARVLFVYRGAAQGFALADELAKERPKDREIALLRADLTQIARAVERYEPTITEIRSLLTSLPTDPALRIALGQILLVKGDLDNAAKEFEQTLQTDVANSTVQLTLVGIYLQKRNYTQALAGVTRLLSSDPTDLRYRLLRANCLRLQKNFGEAGSELITLNSEFPNHAGVTLELASLYLAEGRALQAEAMFRRLFRPDVLNPLVLEGLARSLVAQNKIDTAMDLLHAAQQKHRSPDVDLVVAEVTFSFRRFDKAIESFALADQKSKLTAGELGRYAEALQQSGDLDQAIAVARRARDLEPQKIRLNVFLAFLLQLAGSHDEAITIYRTIIKMHPSNFEASNNLAYMLAEQGRDLSEAKQLASNCVRARADDDGFMDTLGLVLFKQGHFQEAIEVFQRALRKRPSQGLYRYHLALSFLGKGDRLEAKRQLEQASAQSLMPAERAKIKKLLESERL